MPLYRKYIIIFSCFYIGFLCNLFIINSYYQNDKTIETFPSYDWDVDEEMLLLQIIANTEGTPIEKQKAIIDCLHKVWNSETTITNYFIKNYSNISIKRITKRERLILKLTVQGKIATREEMEKYD